MTDSDPSDKNLKRVLKMGLEAETVNTDGVQGYVPIEELEALVQEWRNHNVSPMDGAHDIEKCADELQDLVSEYE